MTKKSIIKLVKIVYDNGDIYEGETLEGLPENEGIYIEKSTGNVYEGD